MEVLRYDQYLPFINGFKDDKNPDVLIYLEGLKRAYAALHAGTLYARFISGDRTGSVVKLTHNPAYRHQEEPGIRYSPVSFRDGPWYRFENEYFFCVCSWDDRRNTVKVNFPNRVIELLLNYDGPTVWAKFDAKSAKEKVLQNPDQKDIDGNVLSIGDKVMYINARYGSRMGLERGTVKEFKVVVNSHTTSISTIIENVTGELSTLSYPEDMVCKL